MGDKECQGGCAFTEYQGDNHCDDRNNNCGCDWDKGDCCSIRDFKQRGFTYCQECLCKDPVVMQSRQCPGNCHHLEYRGDGQCDDNNNNCGCNWDGGDCCGANVGIKYCKTCECLDPAIKGSSCFRLVESKSACSLKHLIGTPTVWISAFACSMKCSKTETCVYFDDRKGRCRLFTVECSDGSKRVPAKKAGDAEIY